MKKRPSARARGYTWTWEKARLAYLAEHPKCSAPGCKNNAEHVHHTTRPRGNRSEFWDRSTWRGLCPHHHNSDAQQVEKRGYSNALGSDGLPTDPNHPFNKERP